MITKKKLLGRLFLLLAFASQCLVSMPPKVRSDLIFAPVSGGVQLTTVDLAAIGTHAVLTLPGNPDNGYVSAFPESKEELNIFLEKKILEIENEKAMMQKQKLIIISKKPARISSFLEVLNKDIKLCHDIRQELIEKKRFLYQIDNPSQPDILELSTKVYEIINNFSGQHQSNLNTFNALCEQPNFKESPHGITQSQKTFEGLKQLYSARLLARKKQALLGQPQEPQTEAAMTEKEREALIKELCGDEGEQTTAEKTKAPSRAPKNKKKK